MSEIFPDHFSRNQFRARLLLTGSTLALGVAMAIAPAAAVTITSTYQYTVGTGSTVSATTSSAPTDQLPSASDGLGNFVFGHNYGSVNGTFGTRSSGSGDFSISGSTDYSTVLTNLTGAPQTYSMNFVIESGNLNLNANGVVGFFNSAISAAVTLTGPGGTTSPFSYSASLFLPSASASTPFFAESGAVLNASGATFGTGSGDYSWSAYTGIVSLGTLLPGQSETIDYLLTSSASGQKSTILGQLVSSVTAYGGYGGTTDTAVGRIGDPSTFAGTGGPFNIITASSVPEPASMVILGAGLAGLAFMRRRGSR